MNYWKIFLLPFKGMFAVGVFLFKQRTLNRTEGANFATPSEYKARMNASNKGLLLDGDALKLGERESFQNVCVIARVGAGKTSRYIIPNVLERSKHLCSLVINDPKGEVYEATSHQLASRGFRLLVINPDDPDHSHTFNPLEEAHDEIELDQIAEILIKAGRSTNSNGSDEFWMSGAQRFVSVFLGCLKNASYENPNWNNLANLYYLFQNFGEDGSRLDRFMARYSVDPHHPQDERLWNEWQGVLTGNKEGVQSFILNALTALKPAGQRNIARITARSSFELESIRHTKTAIFFITPPQHAEYYGFLTSLFFRSVFNASMRTLPNRHTLPLYVLYDEFGHSTIPNFVSTANTIRGYSVSLSIVLQSIAQLNTRYGHDYAQALQGGFHTLLTYAGSDPQTTAFFENIIGKTRITQRKDLLDPTEQYREQNLINANEIRTMKPEEILIVSGNQNPVLIPSKGFFEVGWMKRATQKPPVPVEARQGQTIEYVQL
jgi:type IV secretory pathway TraG/TraD family ATPase VirD4